MRGGKYKHLVKIEQRLETTDETGAANYTWSTFARAWAQIVPTSSRENTISGHKIAAVSHIIKIRFIQGVTADMRINHAGRIFEIDPPKNWMERNQELEILALENV